MFDCIIIGAGPAGMSAGVYAKRAGINALIIEESPIDGGQILSTYEVDNYLGFPGISGLDLGENFSKHLTKTDIDRVSATVLSVDKKEGSFIIRTDVGEYESRTVIFATGAKHATLNVPGEEALAGMGVSYCATCDGAFFKGADVCVVGGSDVAVEDAIYLARTSKKVYLIHRRDTLRAADSLVKSMEAIPNIECIWNTEVVSIEGEDQVEKVVLHNKVSDENSELPVSGVFVAVGIKPASELLGSLGVETQNGYVLAGEDCRTNIPGVYAAGDIRKKPLRQIITAVCDGANAATSAGEDLV